MGLTQKLGTIPLAISTDASNNVGIGAAASGSYKLQVTGTTNLTGALSGTSATFSSTVSATGDITGNGVTIGASDIRSSSNVLTLGGTSEVIRITSGGNVGIGTTSPNAPLNVVKDDGVSAGLHILADFNRNTSSAELILGYNADGTNVTTNTIYSANSLPLAFHTTAIERMRITSAGNVGIGTSSPVNASLHIANPISSETIRNQDNSAYNTFYNNAGNVRTGYIQFNANSPSTIAVDIAQALTFNTNGTERLRIASSGAVTVYGSLSKGSGSFRIEHPLESLSETHQLVHSFIEGPQADLIYRGKITLINGKAQANIDEVSTMSEGTFEALCREVQCFTTNETGWDLIKGKVIGNIIYIESQNVNSTDEISWLVIGERKDKHIMDTDWTDENGKVIVEPLKPIKPSEPIIN